MSLLRAGLAAACLLLGMAAGVPEPDGYRMDHYRDPVPDTLQGAQVIHTRALAALSPPPLLIDVLPAPHPPEDARPGLPRLPLPHRDLPRSHWLPETGRGALPPALEAKFRARVASLTGGDLARPIAVYCLSQCWMSWNAAKRLVAYGYRHVLWYPDGADGWAAAGLPVEVAKEE